VRVKAAIWQNRWFTFCKSPPKSGVANDRLIVAGLSVACLNSRERQ
jgi:hypothetical protein